MKIIFTIILLSLQSYYLVAQSFKRFKIDIIIGTKLHTDNYIGPDISEAWQLKSSLLLGLEVSYRKFPNFSLIYLSDRFYFLLNQERTYPITSYQDPNLFSISKGNLIGLYYRKNHFKYGIGHYSSLHEDYTNYFFSSESFLKQHVALSFSFVTGNASFEFVKLLQYKKLFSIFNIDNQYITIKYNFHTKKHNSTPSKISKQFQTSLIFKTGLRSFPIRASYLPGEQKDRIGISLLAGVELKFNKINTSAFIERDWRVRFNGGSPFREVKGYVVNSVVGLKYGFPRLRDCFVRCGYAWITDYNTIYETWKKIELGEEKKDLFFYNVKGITLGIGYPLSKKFDLDLRGIIPLRGEGKFNPMRYSIGFTYNIYP